MVEPQPSKLMMPVRSWSAAPRCIRRSNPTSDRLVIPLGRLQRVVVQQACNTEGPLSATEAESGVARSTPSRLPYRSQGCTDGPATQTTLTPPITPNHPQVCYKSLYFLKPPLPSAEAAAPPPRRAVGAFGPSAAELQPRGRVPSIGVHQLRSAPYYPRTSVRGSWNLSKGTRRLPGRPAGLRPPLMCRCLSLVMLRPVRTMG